MRTFYATICSGNTSIDGERLSEEAIKNIISQAPGTPVNFNFCHELPMGFVNDCSRNSDTGMVEAELTLLETVIPRNIAPYIVPSIRIIKSHKEGDTLVIDECNITDLGLTLYPADVTLTPLESRD